MAQPASKKQRTHPTYELLYHPGIPGRGEHVRLLLEGAGVPYVDTARDQKDGYSTVQQICMNGAAESTDGNPPTFAPPGLRVSGAGKDGKSLVISQTPNILAYLGEKTGMDGEGEQEKYWVAQVAQTALDLNNEVHDTHHPVAVMKYYEEQKEESLKKAADVRENRLPKFFGFFTRMLEWNEGNGGKGKYLIGSKLTYADTTVWQVLDGLYFAFPKEMEVRKKEFSALLDDFYNSVKSEKGIKEYLASDKRFEYSMGIFRNYPELDRQ
ncbi:uncharacterized protein LTR77_002600 [Saxophila tyrrhenica]|uniref:Glutathione S-transferase n=1 Tax=Saxophila tyrrhenica TaxID=1690608 RepID=A0AAV9PJY7_9PEZI|nr:hypothetical protein LTR77_002600 [Saxophila tyrrhenica]